mmetsp:Transcript_44833/g.51536  ORF Transcript_44833/g.51536 Transcript_44833/m.51536 type:complete len:671 (-) Transcript_44833:105-2117(-)
MDFILGILILAAIALIVCLLIVIPYIFFGKLRRFPGNFIFLSSVFLSFDLLTCMIQGIWLKLQPVASPTSARWFITLSNFNGIFFQLWMTYETLMAFNFVFIIVFPFYSLTKAAHVSHLVATFIVFLYMLQMARFNHNSMNLPFSTETNKGYFQFGTATACVSIFVTSVTNVYCVVSILRGWMHEELRAFTRRSIFYSISLQIVAAVTLWINLTSLGYFAREESKELLLLFYLDVVERISIITTCVIRITDPHVWPLYKKLFLRLCTRPRKWKDTHMYQEFKIPESDLELHGQEFSPFRINSLPHFGKLQTSRSFYVSLIGILSSIHLTQDSLSGRRVHDCVEFNSELSSEIFEMETPFQFEVQVKVYLPRRFATFREKFNIFFSDLFNSLNPEFNEDALCKAKKTDGKSDSFFLFTTDKRFIVKAVSQAEVKSLMKLCNSSKKNLPDYFAYFEGNPRSMISRVYGAFRLRHAFYASNTYLLLMENVKCCFATIPSLITYDLKGSSYGRQTLKKRVGNRTIDSLTGQVLKDNDFKYFEENLSLDPEEHQRFFDQLRQDLVFLQWFNLIDYSLLLSITPNSLAPPIESTDSRHRLFRRVSHQTYQDFSVSIIDYLQRYNTRKKVERCLKAAILRTNSLNISVQSPRVYARRIEEFFSSIVLPTISHSTSNL